MKRALEQVAAFNRMVGAPKGDVTKPDATVDMGLRLRLIAEEFDELMAALSPFAKPQVTAMDAVNAFMQARTLSLQMNTAGEEPNMPEVADALADLAFVTIGANDVWGIPGDAVWEEVCRANMAKLGGPKDPKTGKALKPPGWTPPDIDGVLKREAEAASRRRPHRRGDQLQRTSFGPRAFDNFNLRWLLDEQVDERRWWAYELDRGGVLGRRTVIDVTVMPTILEPWPRDIMPGD